MRTSARFAINVVSNWSNTVFAALIGAFIIPYAKTNLGDTLFGLYGIAFSIRGILEIFDFGLTAAVTRFAAQDQGGGDRKSLREMASSGMAILGSIGGAAGLTMLVAIPAFTSFYGVEEQFRGGFAAIAACLAVAMAMQFCCVTGNSVIAGANRYELTNGVEILANIVRVITLVALFECFGPTLLFFGLSFVFHQFTRLTMFFFVSRHCAADRALYSVSSVTRSSLNRIIGFSLISSMASLGGAALINGPGLVIGRMLGEEVVAAFVPALFVATQLRVVISGLCSPLVPLAAKDAVTGDGKSLSEWSLRLTRLACVLSLAMVVPIMLLTKPLIEFWIGPEDVWTAPVFQILIIANLLAAIQSVNRFIALGATSITPWAVSQAITATVGLGGAILGQWLFQWGLLGVVSSVGTALAARNLLYVPWLACRQFRTSLLMYYLQTYGRCVLPTLLATAIAWGVLQVVQPTGLIQVIIYGGAIGALFAALAWPLALTSSDREVALSLVRSAIRRASGGNS